MDHVAASRRLLESGCYDHIDIFESDNLRDTGIIVRT